MAPRNGEMHFFLLTYYLFSRNVIKINPIINLLKPYFYFSNLANNLSVMLKDEIHEKKN